MKLRHGARAPLKVLLVLGTFVVLAAALNGSAGSLPPPVDSSCDPPNGLPTSGRIFCVHLKTYDGTQATGGQKVELQILNHDNNTLTNPSILLTWVPTNLAPANLTVAWADPKPSNCQPAGSGIRCTLPNVPGLGSGAGSNPPSPSATVTLYFQTSATGASPSITWTAEGTVNEGGSGTPNQSVRTVSGSTAFGGSSTDSPLTFALPGQNVLLGTTTTGNASLKFAVPSGPTPPYETSMTADDVEDFCFGGLECYPLQLTSSVSGATTGLLVWHFLVVDSEATPAPSASKLKVIHRYDFANVPANPTTDTFTGDFRAYVGARIGTQDYYVRNATATTFKLSTSPTGPTGFYNVQSSPVSLSRIRIIGDDKPAEIDTRCNASLSSSTPAANQPRIPSINATTVAGTENVDVFVCDSGNGNVGPWG